MKKTNAIIVILTVFVVLVVANFLTARHPIRLDLTEKGLYTLSKSTKEILKNLDDVVTVRLYFTQNLPPQMQSLKRDVDDVLSEFKGAGGSHIQIEFVDPASSPLEEQKVAMLGIPPVQLNVVEKDKQEVAKIYLGMVVMFGDSKQVIPVIQNISNLEYELAQAIIKVSSKELPRVAWWEQSNPKQPGSGFTIIKNAMGRRYEIQDINDKNVSDLDPAHFSALVLASPRNFAETDLLALDQYIMKGGKVLALIDRWEVGPSLNIAPVETNVTDLLSKYGVTVEDSLVVDRASAMASFSGGFVTYHVPYPFWPEISKSDFNQTEPIVANLESAVFTWTAPLVLSAENGGGRVLARTSEVASAVSGKDIKLDPQSATEYLVRGEHKQFPLSAIMDGPFKSHYSGERSDALLESKPGARIFVVGSSAWASDRILSTFPVNGNLFENALDSFAMGDALIGIRSREGASRPIKIISDGARLGIRYANLLAGPLAVVIIGAVIFLVRRSKRHRIRAVYKST